jgi:hypothetical protein
MRHVVSPHYYACRLELDINTIPEFQGVFERGQLHLILEELVNLAKEMAEHGDTL